MKIVLPTLSLLFLSCFLFDDEKMDEQNTNLTLSLHSAGVTTVKLNVNPADSLAEFTFELTRDDFTLQTLSLKSDTLIKDTGLNPNTSYTYNGYWLNGTERIGESDSLTVITMDTTSQNFTWEIDTLGDVGSYLNDVWIVDENDIWVVGYLSIPDSAGYMPTYANYNAARWDGEDWTYLKIGDTMPQGFFAMTTLYGIHYFNENDIWVMSGVPLHWNGEKWEHYLLHYMGVLPNSSLSNGALWGTSTDNMYFVGRDGSIIHYDGNEFMKMESRTNILLTDIWGISDDSGENVWVCGWDSSTGQSIVLTLIEGQWQIVYERYSGGNGNSIDQNIYAPRVNTIWTNNKFDYLLVGGGMGLFTMDKYIANDYEYIDLVEELGYFSFPEKIVGIDINDIFIVGAYGTIFHFNGLHWDLNQTFFNDGYEPKCVNANSDNIVIVGEISFDIFNKAFVIRGYR